MSLKPALVNSFVSETTPSKNDQPVECLIAFGGNVGDVADSYQRLLAMIETVDVVELVSSSKLYRTAPVGEKAGVDYLNAAFILNTNLSPYEVLQLINAWEHQLGRERIVHWGPRTVDLDLILYGQLIMNEARLTIPHPACWYRRFVLDPLVEIIPDAVHPIKKVSLETLQQRLLSKPFRIALAGGCKRRRESFLRDFQEKHSEIIFRDWQPNSEDEEATLVLWMGIDEAESQPKIHYEDLPKLSRLDLLQGQPTDSVSEDEMKARIRSVIQSATDSPEAL